MTWAFILIAAMLTAAALLSLLRVIRGPSLLDRVVAMDVMLAVITGSLAVYAAVDRNSTVVPVLVVVSLLGFIGSVTITRFLPLDAP